MIGEDFPAVLAAARDGAETAFARLWRDANPSLLRYLRVLTPHCAEDVAAETWLQVIRRLPAFRGDESAWRAWLFTTARRRAIDESRRRARRPEAPLEAAPPAGMPRAPDTADEVLERFGTRSALALLTSLPPAQAEIIMLRVVAGLDTATVARMVRRSQGAVRVASHRGLRRLAELATEAGVTL